MFQKFGFAKISISTEYFEANWGTDLISPVFART